MKKNISIMQFILILFLTAVIFFIANYNPLILKMKSIITSKIPDVSLYSAEQIYNYMDNLGTDGRKTYIRFLLIADMIFPIGYSILFSLIFTFFLQRMVLKESKLYLIRFSPFIIGALDILQNIFFITMLSNYPEKIISAANLASTVTVIKVILTNLTVLLLLVVIIIFIFQKSLFKKNK